MFLERTCPVCGRPQAFICPPCWAGLPWSDPDEPWLWRYEHSARAVVLAVKQGGRRDLLGPLGVVLGRRLERLGLSERVGVVTWVPANRGQRRRRGFDQGAGLATGVARALGVPARGLLDRGHDPAQTGRDRAGRLKGPALRLRRSRAVRRRWGSWPGSVVLVDDVVTTGATRDTAIALVASALPVTASRDVGQRGVVFGSLARVAPRGVTASTDSGTSQTLRPGTVW